MVPHGRADPQFVEAWAPQGEQIEVVRNNNPLMQQRPLDGPGGQVIELMQGLPAQQPIAVEVLAAAQQEEQQRGLAPHVLEVVA